MGFDQHANFAYSTIAVPPSPATTGLTFTLTAGDGSLFPAPPYNATVWPAGASPTDANAEIVRVISAAGDTFTVLRAQEASNQRAIVLGDQIENSITAKVFTDIEGQWVFAPAVGSVSGTVPLDLQFAQKTIFPGAVLTGNVTYQPVNATPGAEYVIEQTANGHTPTYGAGTKWTGGIIPTPSAGTDLVMFVVWAVNGSNVPTSQRGRDAGQGYA